MLSHNRYHSATMAPLSVPATTPSPTIDVHHSNRLCHSRCAALLVVILVAVFISSLLCLFCMPPFIEALSVSKPPEQRDPIANRRRRCRAASPRKAAGAVERTGTSREVRIALWG